MLKKVRIRATGQIVELIPRVAEAMLSGGTAEEVVETTMVNPREETAVAPAQNPQPKKLLKKRA
jgi:hypothetical protein